MCYTCCVVVMVTIIVRSTEELLLRVVGKHFEEVKLDKTDNNSLWGSFASIR